METLTPRQRRIMEFIRGTVQERGYPPTVREIGEAVGLTSSSSVHSQLANLERRGLLTKDPSKPRALGLHDRLAAPRASTVPLIGRIAAGAPILAEEHIEDVVAVPEGMTGRGEHFALRVSGESMTGAGILDGDLVVVKRQDIAEDGEIVAAVLTEGAEPEATVKRLRVTDDGVELHPENPAFSPIGMRDGWVAGRVVGVIRQLP